MINLELTEDTLDDVDVRQFNRDLLKMIINLDKQLQFEQEKNKHLESLLLSLDVPVIKKKGE